MEQTTAAAIGDVELAVYEAGDGPPVLLLHGFPELAYSWRHQLPALADAGYRAVAVDLRGYGASSKPAALESYALTTLVGDTVGLLDALGADDATLVGHDWGAIIAWSTAVLAPHRVRAVASLNVPYRGWCCGFPSTDVIRERLADRFGYVLRFQEPGVTEQRFSADPETWLRRTYSGVAGGEVMSPRDFAVYVAAFESGGITGPLNYYRNIDRNVADVAEHANAPIECPTLMIAPDRDPVLPSGLVDGMDRWIPDLRTELVTTCGHWTQQEQPAIVNRHLVTFLDEVHVAP